MASIKILDPTAKRMDDNASPGPDAGELAGKRVGFRLDQIWRCWDLISENWAQKFEAAGATVTYWRSTNRSGEEGEEQARSLEAWLKTVDIVVSGLANCGSCTGWTIRDAIAAANSGVPTVAVATKNFEDFAHELAARGGRSGLRVHVLPYPLNELSREEVEPVAEAYFDGLLGVMGASLTAREQAGVTIHRITPSHRSVSTPKLLVSRDCGPAGCEVDWLTSRRFDAEDDIEAFTTFSLEQGWGDGLPLIPPTDARVRTFLSANDRYPDELIARMPDSSECTVEKIVINAVMAGAPAASLELIIAAIAAISEPDFELYGVNATTASVYPGFIVNGPVRDALDIPYGYGCAGGVATRANAIGRAIRLIMRNVAGQVAGVSSQTTFGSPGRTVGLLMGEWEEKSPWAPLAERRARITGNAVTAFSTMGTMNILDTTSTGAMAFLEMIGKSVSYAGANCYSPAMEFSEMTIGINPICADLIAREVPRFEDVQEIIWKHARVSADWLQGLHRGQLEDQGRVRGDGYVYATPEPKDLVLFVGGGLGGLHALGLHSFGSALAQTKSIATAVPAAGAVAAA